MIATEEVMELGARFRELVRTHAPVEDIEPFFIDSFILIPDGQLMSLEAHQAMHLDFVDETHHWREMSVVPICEDPERVRATGSVAWEASFRDGRPGRIRSVVEETWVIERGSDGDLRWVLYWSNSIDLAEGSASFDP